MINQNGGVYSLDPISNEDLTEGLADKVNSTEKGAINGVAELDANQKLKSEQIPDITITDTFVVASEVEMLSLTAEKGDVAVRTDETKTYILKGTDPSVLANWQELQVPSGTSVSYTTITANTTLEYNKYYIVSDVVNEGVVSNPIELTLPSTAGVDGDFIKIINKSQFGYKIIQNSNNVIYNGYDRTELGTEGFLRNNDINSAITLTFTGQNQVLTGYINAVKLNDSGNVEQITEAGKSINETKISKCGNYCAIGGNFTGYLKIYRLYKTQFGEGADFIPFTSGLTGTPLSIDFSEDGKWMAVGTDTSPYMSVYSIDKETNTFTKLANPSSLPTSGIQIVKYSPDSQYLYCGGAQLDGLLFYKVNSNGTLTSSGNKLDINNSTSVNMCGVAKKIDGSDQVFHGSGSSKFSSARGGDYLIGNIGYQLKETGTNQVGVFTPNRDVYISKNNKIMGMSSLNTSPYFFIYNFTGTHYVQNSVSSIGFTPTNGNAKKIIGTEDGRFIYLIGNYASFYIKELKRNIDRWSVGTIGTSLYPTILTADISKDGKYMIVSLWDGIWSRIDIIKGNTSLFNTFTISDFNGTELSGLY